MWLRCGCDVVALRLRCGCDVVALCLDWNSRRKRKMGEMAQALGVTPVDVAALRRMAISEGGLLSDEMRCQVWPRLLNMHADRLPEKPGEAQTSRTSGLYQSIAVNVLPDAVPGELPYAQFSFTFSDAVSNLTRPPPPPPHTN